MEKYNFPNCNKTKLRGTPKDISTKEFAKAFSGQE
jgi:hypothetical protein